MESENTMHLNGGPALHCTSFRLSCPTRPLSQAPAWLCHRVLLRLCSLSLSLPPLFPSLSPPLSFPLSLPSLYPSPTLSPSLSSRLFPSLSPSLSLAPLSRVVHDIFACSYRRRMLIWTSTCFVERVTFLPKWYCCVSYRSGITVV